MKRRLYILTSIVQGSYWMLYAAFVSFASVYLLAKGFSNSMIGMIIAAGFAFALVLQPLMANLTDHSRKITLPGILQFPVLLLLALTCGLLVCRSRSAAMIALYVLIVAWHTALQPLVNSFSFYLERSGYEVNFGTCRAIASVLYALAAALLGILIAKTGEEAMPVVSLLILAAFSGALFFTSRTMKTAGDQRSGGANPERPAERKGVAGGERAAEQDGTIAGESAAEDAGSSENTADGGRDRQISFSEFLHRNILFFIVSLGTAGIFFGHAVHNTFTIQIVAAAGGDSGDMGILLSFMALCELPGLVFFKVLNRKFKAGTLIKFSAAGFLVKNLILWRADSVFLLYIGHFMQMFGFGLFLPAMVYFIQEVMEPGEAVRGQSTYTMMVTASTILSSMTGGFIIDGMGIKVLLFLSAVIAAAGTAVIFSFVDRVGNHNVTTLPGAHMEVPECAVSG